MNRWLKLIGLVLAFVLVPFALFGQQLESWMGAVLTRDPSPIMALLLVIALVLDVALPIPSSLISSYACQRFGPAVGSLIITLGMSLSFAAAYGIGRYLGTLGTRRTLGEESYLRAMDFGTRRGGKAAVALSRAVPVLAEAVGLLSGALRWPFLACVGWASLAGAGVASAYALLFACFGQEAGALEVLIGSALIPALGMVLGTLVLRSAR
jgi:uncharacterized membrane protein YdjX (TVP38/TMEM64 family)